MAIERKKKDKEDNEMVIEDFSEDQVEQYYNEDEEEQEPVVAEQTVEVPEVPSATTPMPTTKNISATEAQALLRKYHDAQKEVQAALEGTKFRTVQIQLAQQLVDTAKAINDLG
jgi:23S rRNA pseudoU1915 N3-methylase RlmH